ncbi:hypothetical protein VNO77_03231 [Canavalia gladiata]|uniref:Uncharacterized protein n=1 Tax=Canavalia gladiata TaxID=3824 RepID=A0AAN9MUD7_CANGL
MDTEAKVLNIEATITTNYIKTWHESKFLTAGKKSSNLAAEENGKVVTMPSGNMDEDENRGCSLELRE